MRTESENMKETNEEEYNKTINKALEMAERIPDEFSRPYALTEVAKAFANVGRIEEALKIAERIPEEDARSYALECIVEFMVEVPVVGIEVVKQALSEKDDLVIMLSSSVEVEDVVVEFMGLDLKPVKIKKLKSEMLRFKPLFEPGKKKLKIKVSYNFKGRKLDIEREFDIEFKPTQEAVVAQRLEGVEEKRFLKYKLIELVGSGAFADVYRAVDEKGGTVALKIYRGYEKAFLEEIGNFVQLTKRLSIPYVVKPLDYGLNPKPYVVMEYYPMTLRDLMKRDIELKKKLRFMYRLAKALSYAHSHGIFHGDLKPENILVFEGDGEYYPAIADWGGGYTPCYSAPELVKSGGRDLNNESDVYSFGVILYEILTGRRLFEDPLDYIERGESIRVELKDKELEDIVNACLSKPGQRPGIEEVRDRIAKHLIEVIGTRYSSSLRSRDVLEVISVYIDSGDTKTAKNRMIIAEKYNFIPKEIIVVVDRIMELMNLLVEYSGRTIPLSLFEQKYRGVIDLLSQDIAKKIREDRYSPEHFIDMKRDITPDLHDSLRLCINRLKDIVFAHFLGSLP